MGTLGVPRMLWLPNTFPLHNYPLTQISDRFIGFLCVKLLRLLFAF